MAMSRKHYREAADVVNSAHTGDTGHPADAVRLETARDIAKGLARMFKIDNSNFDREKFMDACGLGEPDGN